MAENLNKPIDGSYPKLAGQHSDYLLVALKSYQNEKSGTVGRGNAIMGAQVKAFSNTGAQGAGELHRHASRSACGRSQQPHTLSQSLDAVPKKPPEGRLFLG